MSLLEYLAFAMAILAVIAIIGAAIESCERLDTAEAGEQRYGG